MNLRIAVIDHGLDGAMVIGDTGEKPQIVSAFKLQQVRPKVTDVGHLTDACLEHSVESVFLEDHDNRRAHPTMFLNIGRIQEGFERVGFITKGVPVASRKGGQLGWVRWAESQTEQVYIDYVRNHWSYPDNRKGKVSTKVVSVAHAIQLDLAWHAVYKPTKDSVQPYYSNSGVDSWSSVENPVKKRISKPHDGTTDAINMFLFICAHPERFLKS